LPDRARPGNAEHVRREHNEREHAEHADDTIGTVRTTGGQATRRRAATLGCRCRR
jgi:hypothetical protein